jgi:membrane-associated phospholipid phosphatase
VAVVSAGLVVALVIQARWPSVSPGRLQAWSLVIGGAWGAVMAWGRVAMLAHWLSDVIAGWCLGMIALVVALRFMQVATTLDDLSPVLRALRRSRS